MSETRNDSASLGAIAADYGIQALDAVPDAALDAELISGLPVEWARSNVVLPIRFEGEKCLLVSDPSDVSAQEYVSLLLGCELKAVLSSKEQILKCIEKCYFSKDDSPDNFLKDMPLHDGEARQASRSDDLLSVSANAPVTQLVNLILLDAVKKKASDIHVEPFESKLRIRYRIDGAMYEQSSPPRHVEESLVSRLKVMGRMDIAEKRLPQDGMAKVRVGEREIDIRVSTVPVAEGERVVLRLLDRDSSLLPLGVLGMSDACLDQFNELLERPNGMIVVSGPTGSGKTTTLYAALNTLNSERLNILTIEEPIEYQLPDIGQIQVKPKIGLTFASGLRHILRQDPDVILVGETRDLETAEIAIRASLTGHLVFTTLHTNDAISSVIRLVDMGVEPFLISSCLEGVLAQRLVRQLCSKCSRKVKATAEDAARLGRLGAQLEGKTVREANGCDDCLEGYSGRLGIFELFRVGEDVRELMRKRDIDSGALQSAALKSGMISLGADGVAKILAGKTSISEVLDVIG